MGRYIVIREQGSSAILLVDTQAGKVTQLEGDLPRGSAGDFQGIDFAVVVSGHAFVETARFHFDDDEDEFGLNPAAV